MAGQGQMRAYLVGHAGRHPYADESPVLAGLEGRHPCPCGVASFTAACSSDACRKTEQWDVDAAGLAETAGNEGQVVFLDLVLGKGLPASHEGAALFRCQQHSGCITVESMQESGFLSRGAHLALGRPLESEELCD